MGAPQVASALPGGATGTHTMTGGNPYEAAKWQGVADNIAAAQEAQRRAAEEAAAEQERQRQAAQMAAAQSQYDAQNQAFQANLAALQNPAPQQVQTPDFASRRAGGGFFGAPAMLGTWNDTQTHNPRNTFLGN